MLVIFLLFITSMASYANEVPAEVIEDDKVVRAEQYVIKFNKLVKEDCRFVVYVDTNQTKYIIKSFAKNDLKSFTDFQINQNENLKASNDKKYFLNVLRGKTKDYIFSLQEGMIIIKYNLLDEKTNLYSSEESILKKDLSC